MTHTQLVLAGERYARVVLSCGKTTMIEPAPFGAGERPDVFGIIPNTQESVSIECKVSRADFLADRNKSEHRVGDRRYFLVPAGMLMKSDVPHGYGILESPDGESVTEFFGSLRFEYTVERLLRERRLLDHAVRTAVTGKAHLRSERAAWLAIAENALIEHGAEMRASDLVKMVGTLKGHKTVVAAVDDLASAANGGLIQAETERRGGLVYLIPRMT